MDFPSKDILERYADFKHSFLKISDSYAPIEVRRLKQRHNPWVTSDIVTLIYKRDFLKEQTIKQHSKELWDEYTHLRNDISSKLKKAEKEHNEQEVTNCQGNPQKMWKVFNSLLHNKSHIEPPTELDATMFNDYFSTIGKETAAMLPDKSKDIPWKGPRSTQSFIFEPVQIEHVNKLLLKLGELSYMDVIGFDAKLLWLSPDIICPILTKLFNASLETSCIPLDWKLARVTPIYKGKGDKYDKGNY